MESKPGSRVSLSVSGEHGPKAVDPKEPVFKPGATLEQNIVAAIRTCFDPEIPVNVHDLGLIYDIDIQEGGKVAIRMTLTSPACPVAGALPADVQARVKKVPGVTDATVDLVWDPPWDKSMMSEAAQLQLGMFD